MNLSPLPIVVRATAAALAVFMTLSTLDCMISIAEPQQSLLLARSAQPAKPLASAPQRAVIVAEASAGTASH
jgi:hypothetical protein